MKKIVITIAIALLCLAGMGCVRTTVVNNHYDGKENSVIETIMARRSVRHYTDQAVPRELLQQIAECGVNAPNAMNQQKWEVRIIDNQEYFDGLTQAIKEKSPFPMGDDDPKFRNCLRNATAAIAVACPDDESGMCLINVGLLCENVCLAAKSLGLGSVVMAGPVMMMNTIPDAKPRDLNKIKFVE